MYEMIIPFLAFLSVMAMGGAILAVRAAKRAGLKERLRDDGMPLEPDQGSHPRLLGLMNRIGKGLSSKGPSAGLKAELSRAGYYSSAAPTVYLGAKMLLLLLGGGVLVLLLVPTELSNQAKLFFISIGAGMLFLLPNMVVSSKRRRRRNEMRQHLPDAFDLLEICVSSGMGLDMAWNCVADEVRRVSPVLADEMALTNLEMHLGAARPVALRHMAERTGADEITSLVAVLVQSERFGTSIGDTLRTFAESMRELRSRRAEEAAEKMPVKMLFPLVGFIFPSLMVVLIGPAALQLAKFFKS